jgi:hypothetical protein
MTGFRYSDDKETFGSGATCGHGWNPRYCNECGDVGKLLARVRGLEDIVARLRTGDCWCGVGIGDPRVGGRHSVACVQARELLPELPARREGLR